MGKKKLTRQISVNRMMSLKDTRLYTWFDSERKRKKSKRRRISERRLLTRTRTSSG
jgi:hypothetical protein